MPSSGTSRSCARRLQRLARARPADRRLGQGRGHRRRRDRGADRCRVRPQGWRRRSRPTAPDMMRMAEKSLLLQILDHLWKEHLLHLDHLRQGIHLRGYGQRDPLNEYKREAFDLFEAMLTNLRADRDPGAVATSRSALQPQQVAMAEGAAEEAEPLAATGTDGGRPLAPARPARAPRPTIAAQRRERRCFGRRRNGRRAGARSGATPPAPAVRARNTSTATAGCTEGGRRARCAPAAGISGQGRSY